MSVLDELIHAMNHMTVDQMLEIVKKSGNTENRRFCATGPKGKIMGTIHDAYLGILVFDGQEEGFVLASEFRFASDITWKLIADEGEDYVPNPPKHD
jgi:hypothetical protein